MVSVGREDVYGWDCVSIGTVFEDRTEGYNYIEINEKGGILRTWICYWEKVKEEEELED